MLYSCFRVAHWWFSRGVGLLCAAFLELYCMYACFTSTLAVLKQVSILAEDRATAREVLQDSKGANWIHFALPLVGGDPHISDWVRGS